MRHAGSANAFIDRLVERSLRGSGNALGIETADEEERAARRVKLRGALRIDRLSEDALAPTTLERTDRGDHVRERVEIGTCGGLRMPVYVLLPKGERKPRPAVLALHGHGYGSRELVGIGSDGTEREEGEGIHKHFTLSLVRRGFVVIVPELLGFGERRLEEDSNEDAGPEDRRKSSCYKLSSYLIHLGLTLAGVRAYEVIRALDYASGRPEVRKDAIGSMGLSGGAFVGYLSSALDERVAATVLSGYTNTYEDSYYFSRQHCLCDYVPDAVSLGDMPDLVGLIAPRATFLEAGDRDHLFPLSGVEAAAGRLSSLYGKLGVPDRFDVHVFEGGHEISGERAFGWLAERLGAER